MSHRLDSRAADVQTLRLLHFRLSPGSVQIWAGEKGFFFALIGCKPVGWEREWVCIQLSHLETLWQTNNVVTRNGARTVVYRWWKRIWPTDHSKFWPGHKTYRWLLICQQAESLTGAKLQNGTLYDLGGFHLQMFPLLRILDIVVVCWLMSFFPDTPHNPQNKACLRGMDV